MRPRSRTTPTPQTQSGLDELSRVAELFGLVADRTRAGILYALSESEGLTLPELVRTVDSEEELVVGALRSLRTARMIRSRRHRGVAVYSLQDRDIADLLHMAAASAQVVADVPARRRSTSRLSTRR